MAHINNQINNQTGGDAAVDAVAVLRQKELSRQTGRIVLLAFIGFFIVVIAVNWVFISRALSTHNGVVTEHAYKRGLAYNDVLSQARAQPDMVDEAVFEDGVLHWHLSDLDGNPIDADVQVHMFYTMKAGYDFDSPMQQVKRGAYEVMLDLPQKGQWQAQITASWNSTNDQKQTVLKTYRKKIPLTAQ